MKLLHVNSYYSVSGFYKNLYDKQIENGLDLDVFVPVPTSVDTSDLSLGDYTKVSANHNKYDRVFFYLKHNKIYKDIKRTYNISDYSITHAHSLFSNGYIALKLKQEYGIPYVVAVRNTDINTFFKYRINLRKLGIEILKEAKEIIFLSDSYKELVIKKYIPLNLRSEIMKNIKVIPNGIDKFWFENKIKNVKSKKDDELKLLYIGVINKNKNILKSIEGIKILRDRGLNVSMTIVGRIDDKSIYDKFKNLSFVNYHSPMSKEKLLEVYRNNHIFIMPSYTESFGLVYAEAMSQGLPIIYSKGQGFDKQFDEGLVGYHVNSSDSLDISDKIVRISKNYSRISKRCLKLVDKFCWDDITNQYIDIYPHI